MGALEDVPIKAVRRQIEVTLVGIGDLTQLCLPYMRERKFGKIINNRRSAGNAPFLWRAGTTHQSSHSKVIPIH